MSPKNIKEQITKWWLEKAEEKGYRRLKNAPEDIIDKFVVVKRVIGAERYNGKEALIITYYGGDVYDAKFKESEGTYGVLLEDLDLNTLREPEK